jgi:hypothetical protein
MAQSEANQLEATLVGFVRANNAADELQRKDWERFARIYNGAGQVDRYAGLLRGAYESISQRMLANRTGAQPVASQSSAPPTPATEPAGVPVQSVDLPVVGEPKQTLPLFGLLAVLFASLVGLLAALRVRRV